MVRAAVRLHERMAFAFARGSLADYLRKIGMAEELGLGPQHNANLAKVEDAAILLLAQKIRRARKSGTLKSYLRQINMLELLQKEARPGKIGHNVAGSSAPAPGNREETGRVCAAHHGECHRRPLPLRSMTQ